MGLFDMLFGEKSPLPKETDKMPPIYGGDATSAETAATINCAAMSTAHLIIESFICKHHGQKNTDWKPEIDFFVNKPSIPEFTVRAFTVTTKSDERHTFYFNVARPMSTTKKLMKMMGKMPDDM